MKHFWIDAPDESNEKMIAQECKFCGEIRLENRITGQVFYERLNGEISSLLSNCKRPKKSGIPAMLDAINGSGYSRQKYPHMFNEKGYVKKEYAGPGEGPPE